MHVTACNNPISALSILLEQPDKFDLLLTDLEMPQMDGYELLKIVNKKLRIPVICMRYATSTIKFCFILNLSLFDLSLLYTVMSINARIEVMMKGIQEGACYFLHKPISINLVRNLWIHVLWKKFSDDKEIKRSHSESGKGKAPLVFDSSTPVDRTTSKGIRIDDGSNKDKMKQVQEQEDDPAIPKKRRIIWTPELDQKFEEAVEQLGIEQAIPSKITQLMNVEGIDRHQVGSHLQKYRLRLQQEKERQQAYLSWNQFHCTMNPFYQAEHMGIGPHNISGPSSDPVLVPQTPILPPWVNVPGTGNPILGSFSGSVQPQQIGGCAQQYYNTNCFPNTAFGATDVGINAQTFSTNPAQNIREENTVPITEFASFDNSFQAPGTSIPGCHAAGGLPPSGLLMGSDHSLPANGGQENLGVHEAASSSRTTGDDMDKFLEEFLKEYD